MKKLIIAAAVAIVAVASQAAQVKWTTSGNLTGVDVATIGDNGVYSAGGSVLKNNSTGLTFSLLVYATGTENLVDSINGETVKYATGKSSVSYNWAATANVLEQNTTYDYKLIVTGTQNDLQALGVKGDYDYSSALISAEVTGTFTTAASGATQLSQDISSWTVKGVTNAAPEPTSGLLMLLGMAGLALKRKRA